MRSIYEQLFTSCLACLLHVWLNGSRLGPHVLNAYHHRTMTSSPMNARMTQHLLTFEDQVTGIWSTNLHRADAKSLTELKRPREYSEEWIAELVWLNRMLAPNINNNMWHGSCILLSTLTSVASDLFNYALRLDNELSARPPRGRHGLCTGLKTQMGCLQIVWWNQ